MDFTAARRRFLLAALGAASLIAARFWWKQPDERSLTPGEAATLRHLVDQIVPRDEFPGAADLGVDVLIAAAVAEYEQRFLETRHAIRWIENAAGPAFDWPQALHAAMALPDGSPPHLFVEWLRVETLKRFYADPRAWAGIGYLHPPQPDGFPDYQSAPETHGPNVRKV